MIRRLGRWRGSGPNPRSRKDGSMQPHTAQSIATLYFNSIHDQPNLHLVRRKDASEEEIHRDVGVWYAGFSSCAGLVGGGNAGLPPLGTVQTEITKSFAEKARIAA
jgi:hypothetical protein